jgi:hypothetical protein
MMLDVLLLGYLCGAFQFKTMALSVIERYCLYLSESLHGPEEAGCAVLAATENDDCFFMSHLWLISFCQMKKNDTQGGTVLSFL